MSILRTQNWIGQQRVDVPHLRSIDSSIAADFDVLAGKVQAGEQALVVRGFTVSNAGASVPVASIQLNTADGILYNVNATESGTFLWVPTNRAIEFLDTINNPRIDGSFAPSQVNYVGLDFRRTADASTADLVQILDPDTLLEQPKTVPLGRTLDYRIVISTIPFSSTPNLVPIVKIKTDANNTIDSATDSVQDARNLMFRLGRGGDFPNQYESFSWANGRTEYDSSVSSLSTLDKFIGGDKGILSQKSWMDAVMTRIWEIGGGQNWYSGTADRNVRIVKTGTTFFVSSGDNYEWVGSNLHWQGIKVVFDSSNETGVYYNNITDQTTNAPTQTDLADGDCLYVDLNRKANATLVAAKAPLQMLGEPAVPGARFILAWRKGTQVFVRDSPYPVMTSFAPATDSTLGAVKLNSPAGAMGASPTVVSLKDDYSVEIGQAPYALVGATTALTISAASGMAINASSGGTLGGVIASGTITTNISNGIYGIDTGGEIHTTTTVSGKNIVGTETSGTAVSGTATTGYGLRGLISGDSLGHAVRGEAKHGTSVYGKVLASGIGTAGHFVSVGLTPGEVKILDSSGYGIQSNLPVQGYSLQADTAVSAGTTVTAGTGITATTGNIVATAGAVSAGTTVTAGTGITSTTGDIVATAGNITALGTSKGLQAGTGGVSSIGNIYSTNGSITTSNGNISATGGTVAVYGNSVTYNAYLSNLSPSAGNAPVNCNTITPKNMTQAWANCYSLALGGATLGVTDSFNLHVAPVCAGGGGDKSITFSWTRAFDNANYCLTVAIHSLINNYGYRLLSKTAGDFSIQIYDTAAPATLIEPQTIGSAIGLHLDILAVGSQGVGAT
jgi:hypothetical protein